MKIAFILLTTTGLEYDDRIRKEIFSIKSLIDNVEIKIFAVHGDNHIESGFLSYGVPFELFALKHRGGSYSVISELRKEYDFYTQISSKVKEYDYLWVCDDQPFFFPLFSRKPVIWDLHEIPASIIGGWVKNTLFHYMEGRCKWLIHANHERINYLLKAGVLKKQQKNLILRNYPDSRWLAESNKPSQKFKLFSEWLQNEEYIYVQGLSIKGRMAWETLAAIMETKRIKAVVIGSVPVDIREKIASSYPDSEKYIYYTGQIIQSETSIFIANCKFSMVFYNMLTPNNQYCEPNRMFQCLGLGKPVIVGCNDSMKSVIDKYGNGIVLPSEGSKISDNVNGIIKMMDNYKQYHENAVLYRHNFAWEAQSKVFETLFEKRS